MLISQYFNDVVAEEGKMTFVVVGMLLRDVGVNSILFGRFFCCVSEDEVEMMLLLLRSKDEATVGSGTLQAAADRLIVKALTKKTAIYALS